MLSIVLEFGIFGGELFTFGLVTRHNLKQFSQIDRIQREIIFSHWCYFFFDSLKTILNFNENLNFHGYLLFLSKEIIKKKRNVDIFGHISGIT